MIKPIKTYFGRVRWVNDRGVRQMRCPVTVAYIFQCQTCKIYFWTPNDAKEHQGSHKNGSGRA
jgi:hypothetical protein